MKIFIHPDKKLININIQLHYYNHHYDIIAVCFRWSEYTLEIPIKELGFLGFWIFGGVFLNGMPGVIKKWLIYLFSYHN